MSAWICEGCKFAKFERLDEITLNFECTHPDAQVVKAASEDVLASCESYEVAQERDPEQTQLAEEYAEGEPDPF